MKYNFSAFIRKKAIDVM